MPLTDIQQSAHQAQQRTGQAQSLLQQQQQYIQQIRPPRPDADMPPPDPKNWDYKGALGMQGETLPAGAQGWTPFGQPYFGKGIGGTLKKYQWMLFGAPTSGSQSDLWEQYVEANNFGEKASLLGQGITGSNISTMQQDENSVRKKEIQDQYFNPATKQLSEDAPESVKIEWERLNQTQYEGSLLSPVVRGSKVAMTALFDALGTASVKFEQFLGAQQAIQEYTNQHGGNALSFDINREDQPEIDLAQFKDYINPATKQLKEDAPAELQKQWEELTAQKIEGTKNLANTASRLLLSPLAAWDTLKFITAPGTIEEKKAALETGWNAGKMLYSQMAKPALLEEYKRRAAAGEDTELLAMDLQNPWAEAIGQIILDPLNVVGMFSKAGKVANVIADAENAVKGGSLGDDVVRVFKNAGDNIGEARASGMFDDIDTKLAQNIDRVEAQRLTVNYNSAFDYSPSGLRVKEAKNASTASFIATSAIMKNGGTADDVADFFGAMAKMTSLDKTKRLEGLDEIMKASQRYGMGRFAFSDDAIETGILFRNLTEDSADLVKSIQAAKGDLPKTIEILTNKLEAAVTKQIPTVKELKAAAAGTKQAEQYSKISSVKKVLWNINDGKVGDVKSVINANLGKFYFASPGFGVRNAMNNLFTMVVDIGVKDSLKVLGTSIADIDADLVKWFGNTPASAKGFSFAKAEKAETGISAWSSKVEEGFAKRIYYSQFRKQMDKMLSPGVALPTREEFAAAGLTGDAVDQLVHMVRNNGGNLDEAFAHFAKQVDGDGLMDLWRGWTKNIDAEDYQGLREFGIDKKIQELADMEGATINDINKKFDELKSAVFDQAKGAENNITTIPKTYDVPFADAMNEAARKYGNKDATQRMNVLITAAENAKKKYVDALGAANVKYGTTVAMREKFSFLFNAFSETGGAAIKQEGVTHWDTFWAYARNKGKYTPAQVWEKSILSKQGKFPGNLGIDEVVDQLKKATDDLMASKWDEHFAKTFDAAQPEIDALTNAIPELADTFKEAQKAVGELQMYRTAKFRGGKIFAEVPPQNAAQLAQRYGIASATEAGVPLDKKLLNTINKYSDVKFKSIDEANQNLEAVEAALKKQLAEKGGDVAKAGGEVPQLAKNPEVQILPPAADGATPIPGEMFRQSQEGLITTLERIRTQMLDDFGLKSTEKIDNAALKKLKTLLNDKKGRVTEAVAMSDKVGKHWRDFALLPYGETKNIDLALSYIFPYQFWYSRSYANWMKRVATDPQVLAGYAKLKDAMAESHKDAPEWWRYNLTVPDLLGVNNGHPMSFNIEANIWPLYGLTGTDFNDPEKRTNWFTSTLDDMGKFGPSLWAPINIATAIVLKNQGEDEAAAKWANRLIPQTAVVKALTSQFMGRPVELDPVIQLFSGNGLGDTHALDPYERRRVGRAIAAMIQDGTLTQEQAIDLAESQDGPLWDEAVQRAAKMRNFGQMTSWLFGVGFKGRNPEEAKVDEFYSAYYRLNNLNNEGLIAPEKYKEGWDNLRQQYPFMDALLLSRKSGPDRERAYAYNVLGRVPPGGASEIYKIVGIDPKVAQEFYDNGGNMTGWDDAKKDRFYAAMKDLGAMLAIPDHATRQDWTAARGDYKTMQDQMKVFYGDDILDKLDEYYGMEDRKKAKLFMDSHPEITRALDFQKQATVNNPALMEYYGGIKTLESYYKSKMYDKLYEKYGEGIAQTWSEYYALKLTDPKAANRFKKAHPELDKYSKEKRKLEVEFDRMIIEFAAKLPDEPRPELREDASPSNPVQENLSSYAQQQAPTFQDWQGILGDTLTTIITTTYEQGKALPSAAQSELDRMAERYGYADGDALYRAVLISANK